MTASPSPFGALLAAVIREPDVAAALREVLSGPAADPLVAVDVIAAELGIKPRVITDAAGRDEIELGYAGRKPVVRRSEIARWVATRRRAPKATEQLSPREMALRDAESA